MQLFCEDVEKMRNYIYAFLMENNEITFGQRLKTLRQNKQPKVTQEDVADAIGVTRATYSNWEINRALPDLHLVGLLADYFHVSVDYLLGREKADPLFERISSLDEAKRKAIETLLDVKENEKKN